MLISEFHRLISEEGITDKIIDTFKKIIWGYHKQYRRDFPFREKISPYKVLISEVMLQQTQTGRVVEKYLKFVKLFPSFKSLAEAPLEKVLKAWQGLGYNRRAIALKTIAELIVKDYEGKLPDLSIEKLKSFPQIGHNTASSISTFAFNKVNIFIETNIRRVFIYFFFPKNNKVNDKDIIPLIEKAIDKESPREWYYALMDYGVMLKKKFPNLNKRSAHYKKQSPFKGSNREVRGMILKFLLNSPKKSEAQIINALKKKPEQIKKVLEDLEKEGFVKKMDDNFSITK